MVLEPKSLKMTALDYVIVRTGVEAKTTGTRGLGYVIAENGLCVKYNNSVRNPEGRARREGGCATLRADLISHLLTSVCAACRAPGVEARSRWRWGSGLG